MPRYIIERNVGAVNRSDVEEAARKSKEVLAGLPGVVWIRSYISEAEGKIYCEFDAPDPEAILEHARQSGQPADRISEIALEIEPTMFV
jgi:hypothetical protein